MIDYFQGVKMNKRQMVYLAMGAADALAVFLSHQETIPPMVAHGALLASYILAMCMKEVSAQDQTPEVKDAAK